MPYAKTPPPLWRRYQSQGLHEPIILRPGWKGLALVVVILPLLCVYSFWTAGLGQTETSLATYWAPLLFTAIALLLAAVTIRSYLRGMIALSEGGLYLAHLNQTFPWADVGPCWISTSFGSKQINFVLRRASRHRAKGGPLARALFWISTQTAHSQKGGAVDWALELLLDKMMIPNQLRGDLAEELATLRKQVRAAPDATALAIPLQMTGGLDARAIAAIINAEALRRQPDRRAA